MSGCTSNETAGAGGCLEQQVAEGRGRKARSDCKVTDLKIYVAIITHMGIIKSVALALGIVRSTLYRRIERAPQLKACFDAARAVMVHFAWEQFDEAVKAKARWAIIFGVSRMHGVSMSPAGSSASGSAVASGAAAAKKRATELVAQPDVADAWTLRLVLGVENGEPWAIKYCLSHLDPNGPCGINQIRARRNEELESELEEELEYEEQAEIDPEDAHDYELASGYAVAQHGLLTGRIPMPPAPPVVEAEPPTETSKVAESLRDSNSAEQPDANAFQVLSKKAPPVTDSVLETTDRLVVINGSTWREGEAPAEPRCPVDADSLPQALHQADGESPPRTESSVARGSAGASPSRHVDRRMETELCPAIEPNALPPEAPPLEGATPCADAHCNTTESSRSASTSLGHGFESRSDSATLRQPAAQEHSDGIVARRSRSFVEQKTTLRRPNGYAVGAEQAAPPVVEAERRTDAPFQTANQPKDVSPRFQEIIVDHHVGEPDATACRLIPAREARLPAAPPVMDDDLDDDKATDELFRQIQEMTKKFHALVAPPDPADVAAFRQLLEQARARMPPAPPVR